MADLFPEQLQEHYENTKDSVFVPILDETTGEESWESRNLNEVFNEVFNSESITCEEDFSASVDKMMETLDASISYEFETYLLEQGILDKIKGAASAAGEKIKGVAAGAKAAWDKGKAFFMLKIVDMGLKLALKATQSLPGLLMKTLVMPIVNKLIEKWAQGKTKASEVMNNLKAWGKSKLTPILESVLKPFLWIGMKISGNAKQAAELAPLLMSISVTSMLLGFAIACGGLMCFSNAANGIESGMAAIMESLPPDAGDLAGAMCAESNIVTDGLSETDILREACGILDAAGKEIDDEISARALQILAQRVNDNIDQVETIVISSVEGAIDGEQISQEAAQLGTNTISQTAELVQNATSQMAGTAGDIFGESGMLDPSKLAAAQQQILNDALAQATAEKAAMTIGQAGEKAQQAINLEDLVKKTTTNWNIDSLSDSYGEVSGDKVKELTIQKSKQVLTKINMPGVNESQIVRMKQLAGILKS